MGIRPWAAHYQHIRQSNFCRCISGDGHATNAGVRAAALAGAQCAQLCLRRAAGAAEHCALVDGQPRTAASSTLRTGLHAANSFCPSRPPRLGFLTARNTGAWGTVSYSAQHSEWPAGTAAHYSTFAAPRKHAQQRRRQHFRSQPHLAWRNAPRCRPRPNSFRHRRLRRAANNPAAGWVWPGNIRAGI